MAPSPDLTRRLRKIEKRSFILRLLLDAISRKDRQAYREYQEKLLAHINTQSGSSIIVDSSKSARKALGRFLALNKLAGQDVYVLHLVRDGFAVMESEIVTGNNWALEGRATSHWLPVLRTAVGWVATNIWVPLLGRLIGRDRYLLVRYEDFIEHPVPTLRRIGEFCGFDPNDLIERVNNDQEFTVGHMVGGNRVRLQKTLKLKRQSVRKHGARLKVYQRLTFSCLGGWLRNLYGYGAP